MRTLDVLGRHNPGKVSQVLTMKPMNVHNDKATLSNPSLPSEPSPPAPSSPPPPSGLIHRNYPHPAV